MQLAFPRAPAEVEACHQELLAKQVEILDPPRDMDHGQRTVFFRDPEGNQLEIKEMP
jgi:glyoxylase I family protein